MRQRVLFSCAEVGEDNGGIVLNISEGGVALQVVADLSDHDLPKMRFQFSQFYIWIEVKGRIAWRSASNKMAGLQLIELPYEARGQIRDWISSMKDESKSQEKSALREKTELTIAILPPAPEIAGSLTRTL